MERTENQENIREIAMPSRPIPPQFSVPQQLLGFSLVILAVFIVPLAGVFGIIGGVCRMLRIRR